MVGRDLHPTGPWNTFPQVHPSPQHPPPARARGRARVPPPTRDRREASMFEGTVMVPLNLLRDHGIPFFKCTPARSTLTARPGAPHTRTAGSGRALAPCGRGTRDPPHQGLFTLDIVVSILIFT